MKTVEAMEKTGASAGFKLAEIELGSETPHLVTIPPGIWHGFKNYSARPATLVHLNDRTFNWPAIDEERRESLGGRRQPGQVKGHSPQPGGPVGIGSRLQAGLVERVGDEPGVHGGRL